MIVWSNKSRNRNVETSITSVFSGITIMKQWTEKSIISGLMWAWSIAFLWLTCVFARFPSAFFCVAVVGVCAACMSVIEHNLQRGKTESRPALCMSAGESFYIEIVGLLFSLIACTLALKGRPEPIRPCDYLSVEGVDSDTEPLIGGAERQE